MSNAFLFLAVSGYMLYLSSQRKDFFDDIDGLASLKQDAHAYSGANPEEFKAFLKYLNDVPLYLDTPRVAAGVLYTSLDHLRSVSLYNNYNIEEEVEDIARQIGEKMEEVILEHAIKKGQKFFPKYLNDRVQ